MCHRLVRATALLWTVMVAGLGYSEPRDMRLSELVELLRQQGENILYSSDLVNSTMRVTVDDPDIDDLREWLPEFGLSLRREGGIWIITRVEPALDVSELDPPEVDLPLENVIVTGTLHNLPAGGGTASARRFTADDLASTPALASDVLRTALRLPGMATVGISAKPRIRGGLQDELLIMQDGVELLEPFHLADYHSAYSTIDYYTIESVDISPADSQPATATA